MQCGLTEQPGGVALGDAVFGGVEDALGQGEGVPHHSAVQTILSHDGAPPPRLLRLPPLRAPVLEPHLQAEGTRGYYGVLYI